MSKSRRLEIEAMLKEEPHDIFLRYALAMEMSAAGESEEALQVFKQLTEKDPPHIPAFFRRAQMLADLDRVSEAREELRQGIEQARQQGDLHAAGEMGEMLADLGELGE